MRVAIGEKDWAEITPVEQLTRADRKAVNAVIVFEQHDGTPVVRASMDDDMADAILSRVCADWSLPLPPPAADASSLDRLTLEQDDELRKAIKPHIQAILGQNSPVKENEVPTRASASLGGIFQGFLMTRIRSRGKWWLTSLTRRSSGGRPSRSTSSPSSKTTGLCQSFSP